MISALRKLLICTVFFIVGMYTPKWGNSQDLPIQYRFYGINEEQGLTNGFINKIEQDTLGFVWVGTNDGLFRFDGKKFQSFRTSSINAIPDNTINDLLIDHQNNIWALTNYGLAIYSYQGDSITQVLPDKIFNNGDAKVFSCSVQSKEGIIYLGTDDGLYKYESNHFSKIDFFLKDPIVALKNVSDLEIEEDKLWIGTWEGEIIRYNISTGATQVVEIKSNTSLPTYIFDIYLDSFDRLWVGTNRGVYLVSTNEATLQPAALVEIPELQTVEALSIHVDNASTVWVGTRSYGLFKLDNATLTHFKPTVDGSSVSHRTISAIFQDKSNNIWLGTHNNGIDIFNPAGETVRNINPIRHDETNSYMSQSVWGIHNSSNSGIWMGTDGSGLYHYSFETGDIDLVASTKSRLKLSDDAILCILEDNENSLWIGTYGGGINIINHDRQSVKNLSVSNSPLTVNDIRVIYQDKLNTIWIGTNRGGLYKYISTNKELVPVAATHSLDIRGIIQDTTYPSILWLVTYGEGTIKYDTTNDTLIRIEDTSTSSNFLPIALSISQTKDHIWIGTMRSGLVKIDKKNPKIYEIYDESKGIKNNTIRSVLALDNYIWMGSNTGLSVLNTESNSIRNFGAFDGLQRGQFNDGSILQTVGGNLAFGGIHGLDIFDPSKLLIKKNLPVVTFTKLEIDNNIILPTATDGNITKGISIAEQIIINPNEDIFTIYFGILEFKVLQGYEIEFKLEGFDNNWNLDQGSFTATYRNIPPGEYTFKARVLDPSNENRGKVTSLSVVISPAWWETTYALIGLILIILLVLYLFYRYYRDKVSMNQRLHYEQKQRHQEQAIMQDKISFYTNFSHEMRTPITLITGPVNDLLRSDQIPTGSKIALRLVKRNANNLLKLINRLLEFRRLETEHTILNIGCHDLTILAQEEAESFAYLAKDQGIKFGFYCETNLEAWFDIEKFQIIINNLLSNALKYSASNSKVTFKVSHVTPNIIIEVSDEGRGIETDEYVKIFTPFYQAKNSIGVGGTGIGLALCKNFIELHGGTISVESRLGSGTTFTVLLPEGKAHLENKGNVRFIEVNQGGIEEVASLEDDDIDNEVKNAQLLLVVDDNRDIRTYVASLFETTFEVLQASDGRKALEIATERVPDIIISDIMMPGVDGLEFCKRIKNTIATSHVPVILLTAKGRSQTKKEGYDVGADAYLTKPFDSEILIARVNNLLQSREHLRELQEGGHWTGGNNVPSRELEFILRVEAAVLEMIPNGDLNVIQLCQELGFSRSSLYRKIKSLTGKSINQFIRSIKLKKAAELLATEDMAVSEIAFSLNFTDLKYFRTCFKNQFGKLPSEYQNQMQSNEPINQEGINKALNI